MDGCEGRQTDWWRRKRQKHNTTHQRTEQTNEWMAGGVVCVGGLVTLLVCVCTCPVSVVRSLVSVSGTE